MLDDRDLYYPEPDVPDNPFRPDAATSNSVFPVLTAAALDRVIDGGDSCHAAIVGPARSGRTTALFRILLRARAAGMWMRVFDTRIIFGQSALLSGLSRWAEFPGFGGETRAIVWYPLTTPPRLTIRPARRWAAVRDDLVRHLGQAKRHGAAGFVLALDNADLCGRGLSGAVGALTEAADRVGIRAHVLVTGGAGTRFDGLGAAAARIELPLPTRGDIRAMLANTARMGSRPFVPSVLDYVAALAEPLGYPGAQAVGRLLFASALEVGARDLDQRALRRAAGRLQAELSKLHASSARPAVEAMATPDMVPTEEEGVSALAKFLDGLYGQPDDLPWRIVDATWSASDGRAMGAILSDGRQWTAPVDFGYVDLQAAEMIAERGVPAVVPPAGSTPEQLERDAWQSLRRGDLSDSAVSFEAMASGWGASVVSRALLGLGIVHHIQGRETDAARDWEIARCLDPGVRGTVEALRRISRAEAWKRFCHEAPAGRSLPRAPLPDLPTW